MSPKNLASFTLLVVVAGSLQSFQSVTATEVACGTIATFNSAPLVVAQDWFGTTTITRVVSNTVVYRIHGNADDSCLDAYTVTMQGTSAQFDVTAELSTFKGSEVYKMCSDGATTVCAVPRLVPFFNPRQGAWRDTMFSTSPVPVWTAVGASPGASFSLSIRSGSQSYTTLVAAGYTFQLSISSQRSCTTPVVVFDWSQIAVTAGALSVTVPSLSAGVYTLCMQIVRVGTIISSYFPISAVLGNSVHNLRLGVPATDVAWELQPIGSSRLQYDSLDSSTVRLIVAAAVVADGWTNFGIDTSADICSPLMLESFDSSQLLTYNATHLYVDTVVHRPQGSPGGGQAVLCGARGPGAPWSLLSTSPYHPWVYACYPGYGVVLPTDQTSCGTCGPSVAKQCNNNGYCGSFESKTVVRSSVTCTCYPRFYAPASNCAMYDLDLPTVSPASGTYKARHLVVTVTKPPSANLAVITFLDPPSQRTCSGTCSIVISAFTRFQVKSTTSNGSQSLTPQLYTYSLVQPTDTLTSSSTKSLSVLSFRTSSESWTPRQDGISRTSTLTFSQPAGSFRPLLSSASISQTKAVSLPLRRHQTLTRSRVYTPLTDPNSHTHVALSVSRVQAQSATRTATSWGKIPSQREFSIDLFPDSNYTSSIPDGSSLRPVRCVHSSCSPGIVFSCSSLTVSAIYVSAEQHHCSATFQNATSDIVYSWDVFIHSVPVTRESIWFGDAPSLAATLRYRAATIPYQRASQQVILRSCESPLWEESVVHLRGSRRCIVAAAFAAGLLTETTTIRDDKVLTLENAENARDWIAVEAPLSVLNRRVLRVSPGGVFLGVTTALAGFLLALGQTSG